MSSCKLELHPDKTKLVYCKDYRRKEAHANVKFDFLGYSFQPRTAKSRKTGKLFLGFGCAISISSRKRIAEKLRNLNIVGLGFKSIVGVAHFLNPMLSGRVNYYGKFRIGEMGKVFRLLRRRLVQWARKHFKRYRTRLNKACQWIDKVKNQYPSLFYQWRFGFP
jgi:RNA-directed DNA polymerase